MGMKVNFNLSAILSNDYLKKTDDALALSTQRLSSGYKINRAGDNPSGMAIGRRMRAQIKSLSQANQNASDAVSVVHTAEGALNEIHDMLQRMNELSIKAANGTLSGDAGREDLDKAKDGRASTTSGVLTNSDRSLIQEEITQLLDEVERIASTTEFNGRKLLDGSFDLKGYVEKITPNTDLVKDLDTDEAKMLIAALQSAVTIESYSDEVTPGFYEVSISLGQAYEYTYKDNYDYSDPANPEGKYINTTVEKVYKGYTITGLRINDNDDPYDHHGMDETLIKVPGQRDAFVAVDQRTATVKGDNNFSLTVDVDWSKLTETVPNPDYDPVTNPDVPLTVVQIKKDFQGLLQADYNINSPMYDADVMGAIAYYQADNTDPKGRVYVDVDGNEFKELVKDPADPTQPPTEKTLLDLMGEYGGTPDKMAEGVKNAKTVAEEPCTFTFVTHLTGKGAMTEQIGAQEGVTLEMRIPKISAKSLGISDLNVMSAENARVSICRVSVAIDRLSAYRSRLGAYENRLEHTINSLGASEESMTSAFAGIMDTDMAKEMTIYSQQQVMSQAGTSMLAQANQRPSQLLQLLQ